MKQRIKLLLRRFNYLFIFIGIAFAILFYAITFVRNAGFFNDVDFSIEKNDTTITETDGISVSILPDNIDNSSLQDFRLTILNVGQGSCAIIQDKNECLVFDGGDRDTASYVVSYIKSQGITNIKYVVASHYHSDHVYGLVGVMETIEVKNIICPDYISSTACYQDFLSRVPESKRITPYVGEKFMIGDVQAQVICPVSEDYSDDNGYSIGMVFTYGNFKFLIDGDATDESENDMLEETEDIRADLLIVPHHGSTYSSSSSWLNAVKPTVAVISCGENNPYYHPHEGTLQRLQKCGVKDLYRTDLQGTITVTSDGDTFHVSTEKQADREELWKQGNGLATKEENSVWETTDDTILEDYYIGNTASKKFHRPDCIQLPIEGYQILLSTREEAMLQGYLPCGTCNP